MKQYRVLSESISVFGGNIIRKGDVVSERRLRHIDRLLASGAIELVAVNTVTIVEMATGNAVTVIATDTNITTEKDNGGKYFPNPKPISKPLKGEIDEE